jgi:hypothetical protein
MAGEKQTLSDNELDRLFTSYRDACPDVELSANFMPGIWARIEARRGFLPSFQHLARFVMAACAVACLLLALLNFGTGRATVPAEPNYAEALASDQNAEATYADLVRVSDRTWDASR